MISFEKFVYEKRNGGELIQVIDRGDRRELRFGNHITQSAMSLKEPDYPVLEYTRAMTAGFLFAPHATRFLHIGLGAGSIPRFIHRYIPESVQKVIELSPEVIEVAYRYFSLPVSPRLQVVEDEGESYLGRADEKFQLIFLDAFQAEGVSRHLETASFFASVRNHLEVGGWLINNVWGSDRENLNLVARNLGTVFPNLYSLKVLSGGNVIFFGGNTEAPPSLEGIAKNALALAKILPLNYGDYFTNLSRVRTVHDNPAQSV